MSKKGRSHGKNKGAANSDLKSGKAGKLKSAYRVGSAETNRALVKSGKTGQFRSTNEALLSLKENQGKVVKGTA